MYNLGKNFPSLPSDDIPPGDGSGTYGTAEHFSKIAGFFYDGSGQRAADASKYSRAAGGRPPGPLPGGAAPRAGGGGNPPDRPVFPGSDPDGGARGAGSPGGPGAGGGPGDPDPGPAHEK